jgi:hypothetical protein
VIFFYVPFRSLSRENRKRLGINQVVKLPWLVFVIWMRKMIRQIGWKTFAGMTLDAISVGSSCAQAAALCQSIMEPDF